MHRVAWRRREEGVASSLGTMLAILVLLAIVTMITTSWAPQWTKGKESEHMRVVESQFSSLKALMDQVALAGTMNTVVSTPITLGSGGVPLFSGDASGTISLLSSRSNGYNTLTVADASGKYERVAYGSIVYSSDNTEFLNQRFLYECGAIIITQDDGELVTTGPGLIIQNVSGNIQVSMTLMSIYSDGSSYSGGGTVGVQCRLVNQKITSAKSWPGRTTLYINVTSTAYKAWFNYFTKFMRDSGVGAGDRELTMDSPSQTVHLKLKNVNQVTTDYVIIGASLDLS
jgi:hypothetical protein